MKRMFTKSKTKADILSMLDRMIAQHGDAMSIPMLRVDQSDHLKLYTCALTTGFLQAMICRLPRSLENPEGIQRALVMKKVSEIEERLSSGPYGFPNAIVITLRCQDSPYITVAPLESRTSDSSGIVLLTVALHRYREHIAACAADEAGYLLAPEQELLGYMIDGHHRTEGAYAAGKLDYPFLTGVYLDLDLRKMAASFAEINCNQEKPSAIHTNAIRMDESIDMSAMSKYDPFFGGDIKKWKKYGNSLRMRLAMRLTAFNPSLAQAEFEDAAKGEFIASMDDIAQVAEKDGWQCSHL